MEHLLFGLLRKTPGPSLPGAKDDPGRACSVLLPDLGKRQTPTLERPWL